MTLYDQEFPRTFQNCQLILKTLLFYVSVIWNFVLIRSWTHSIHGGKKSLYFPKNFANFFFQEGGGVPSAHYSNSIAKATF